jgi:hypothetical protein
MQRPCNGDPIPDAETVIRGIQDGNNSAEDGG